MRYSYVVIVLGLFWTVGCGGEDFSQPPAGMQERLAKAGADSSGTSPVTDVAAADPAQAGSDEGDAVDSAAAVQSEASMGKPAADSINVPEDAGSPDAASADISANAADPEVMTASGKTANEIEEKKEANSQKSVLGNSGGLLNSLRGKPAAKGADAPVNFPAGDAPQAISRFGRFALARNDWLRLVTQLTRRFFVAATPNGSRIAVSSGERTAGVVNTQIDRLLQPQLPDARGEIAGPILQSIPALPGFINAIELTHDGNLALIGTTDGRLLVRSTASTADWDLYARDLFLYQEEHRRTSRLSREAIVAVRCLPSGKVLTIDGNGLCVLWKAGDAVHEATPVLEMTVEDAKSPEALTEVQEPENSFPVSGFQVLSLSVDESGLLGAIVTSSEEVTIFSTESGVVVETLNASHFADTQPVCVAFLHERREVLVGLADGRILRRAFGKDAEPVSGIDDNGEPVDYDAVFVPDLQDKRGAITCLALVPGTNRLYFGSLDGNVSRLDISRKRMEQTVKRHEGPVLEFRLTSNGVMSIGSDRSAVLFDMPVSGINLDPNATRTFVLPRDETLQDEEPSDEEASTTAASRKSTRPVRSAAAEAAKELVADISLASVRPADATLALYEHQLRTATDSAQQLMLRKQILIERGQPSAAESLGREPEEIPAGTPLKIAEITTEFGFSRDGWSRVLLSVSDDGTTVAAVHRGGVSGAAEVSHAQAVTLWDLSTGSVLRRWTQPGVIRRLSLVSTQNVILPTPAMCRFSTADGRYMIDPAFQFVSAAFAPNHESLILGHFGNVGVAGAALTRVNLTDRTAKSGLELFESMISAVEFSVAGDSVFVSTRERNQTRLLEVDPLTFTIRHEISKEPLSGTLPESAASAHEHQCGAVVLVPSPGNRMLLTWGQHADGSQLRLWRRSSNNWPAEDVIVVKEVDAALEMTATDRPAAFVNHKEGRVALITGKGVFVLNTTKAKAEGMIPIPDVGGHRPVCLFSPDNNWVLTGDGEGNIWAGTLSNLERKPVKFAAHSGPVAGMAFSANGRYLVTVGEDNRMRSWRVDGFLRR